MASTSPSLSQTVADYWTSHNVTSHKAFATREESIDYFHWRCDQYPGYLSLMPVAGFDGQAVLDYGCGPGHDLVGFREYSQPARLVGVDVSASSLAEAGRRLALHGGEGTELHQLDPASPALPFADASFDYIHSSGVLHHVPDLQGTLRELRRILKPGGRMRVMVYNHDSVWLHLYVAWVLRWRDQRIAPQLPIRDAFRRSTDGPDCPIAHCYTSDEFAAEAAGAGLSCARVGVAVSLWEMQQVQQARYAACMDAALERVHREFLL
jgi:SAM-dependent methyltransferase